MGSQLLDVTNSLKSASQIDFLMPSPKEREGLRWLKREI